MERILIENGATNPKLCVDIAFSMLKERNGGYIVMDNKRELMNTLSTETETEFKKLEKRASLNRINFAWRRGKCQHSLPYSGNVVALFTTKWMIDELNRRDLDSLIVMGWSVNDFKQWELDCSPKVLRIKEG